MSLSFLNQVHDQSAFRDALPKFSWWSHRQRPDPHLKIETKPAQDITRHLLSPFNIEPPNTILFLQIKRIDNPQLIITRTTEYCRTECDHSISVGYFPGVVGNPVRYYGSAKLLQCYVRLPNSSADHT